MIETFIHRFCSTNHYAIICRLDDESFVIYLYSSLTTPHLEQRSTIESSPILKQLCRKSNGLSRLVPEGPPAGAEYKDPSEFIRD